MARAAAAELVGTFVLVLVGTAVATAAILQRQIAGSPYDSLAIAVAFGLVLVALVGAYGSQARTVAHLGATAPTPGSSDLQTFLVEVIIGFVLVLVVVSMTTDSRVSGAAAAVGIGFALAACVLVAGPVSGGAANPARALGPMLVSLKFFSVLAYIFGPVIGGILGAVFYDKFIAATTTPDTEQ